MFTQCRGCGEIFQLTVDDLVTASAMVRCSSCGTVFNSLDTLSEYRPQESANLILHENDNPPPLLTHEFKPSILTKNVVKTSKTALKTEASDDTGDDLDGSIFSVEPDFAAESPKQHSKKPTFMWIILTVLMLVGLLWQGSMALKRGSLQLPEGQLKQQICAKIDCYEGVKQASLNKIALVSRNIRQHPGRDNALIITVGIINSDEKVQNFPALQVKMSNLNGDIVAMRRFLPSEYIDADTIDMGMVPNTLIPITLELQSPGQNAVTFEVGFSPTHGIK
ncbi:MAG TPA: DUF3426 domain-containing protein [Oceanospirillales bacterium]|nr:DUF3426 domain-containing protein [Oceanospirillales bacterium]